jgi:hypothetical protein
VTPSIPSRWRRSNVCGSNGRSAESRHVVNPARTELVDVEKAFDEHDLPPLTERSGKQLGETVGRQVRTGSHPQVEVPRAGGLGVVERACPERADLP